MEAIQVSRQLTRWVQLFMSDPLGIQCVYVCMWACVYLCGWCAYARICEFACTCECIVHLCHEYVCSCDVCNCVSLFTDVGVCVYIFVCACMFIWYVQLFMHACGICFCVVCASVHICGVFMSICVYICVVSMCVWVYVLVCVSGWCGMYVGRCVSGVRVCLCVWVCVCVICV